VKISDARISDPILLLLLSSGAGTLPRRPENHHAVSRYGEVWRGAWTPYTGQVISSFGIYVSYGFSDRTRIIGHIEMITEWEEFERFLATVRPCNRQAPSHSAANI
jgi:hypothetical protein